MVTNLAPAKAYLHPPRKQRLDRIVEATSNRMTISKLLDEAAELALPLLEKKYGVSFPDPTQGHPHSPRRTRRKAA